MYSPPHYRTDDQPLIDRVIDENQFAVFMTLKNGEPTISHLPLLRDGHRLIGHMARANQQWREFPVANLSIFSGPHGYISPAWYQAADDNVPTWNYVTAHVRGEARVLAAESAVFDALTMLVQNNEAHYKTGWMLPLNDAIKKLSTAIVAFEIVDLNIEAKFKMSQKIDAGERVDVIEGLRNLEVPNESLATWMELTRLK